MATLYMTLLCFLGGALITGADPCSVESLNTCLQPLNQYKLQDGILPIYTNATLQEICRKFGQVKTCVDTLEEGCSSANSVEFRKAYETYEFLCDNQNLADYLQYRACLDTPGQGNKLDLEESANHCNFTYPYELGSADQSKCYHIKKYLLCLEYEVSPYCGYSAGEWQRNYAGLPFKSIIINLNCSSLLIEKRECYPSTCFLPLENFTLSDNTSVLNMPANTSRPICQVVKAEVAPCLTRLADACTPPLNFHILGILESYEYLCMDNGVEYEKDRECLVTLEEEVHDDCDLRKVFNGWETLGNHYCQRATTWMTCVDELVTSGCGPHIAAWYRGLLQARMKPVLDSINCDLPGSASSPTPMILLGSWVTILGIMLFSS